MMVIFEMIFLVRVNVFSVESEEEEGNLGSDGNEGVF